MAAISLPCHLPRQTSPVGDPALAGSLVCRYSSLMLMPLWRERVASRDRVFRPSQLWSLNSRFRRSWPSSAARSVANVNQVGCMQVALQGDKQVCFGTTFCWMLFRYLPHSAWAGAELAELAELPNESGKLCPKPLLSFWCLLLQ